MSNTDMAAVADNLEKVTALLEVIAATLINAHGPAAFNRLEAANNDQLHDLEADRLGIEIHLAEVAEARKHTDTTE